MGSILSEHFYFSQKATKFHISCIKCMCLAGHGTGTGCTGCVGFSGFLAEHEAFGGFEWTFLDGFDVLKQCLHEHQQKQLK